MRNYDKRVKQTRVFLDDYYVVKGLSRQLGISMAEALHKLLVGRIPEAKPRARPVTQPAFKVPVARVALRMRRQVERPVLVTNGHKAGVFVIKPKGGTIQ
jgi:hypothetical protein